MKTAIQFTSNILFILTAFIQFNSNELYSQNCSYNWVQQSSGTTQILNSVKAVNEQICWTAGANSTVRKTTNGGTTWINANPNPGIINGNIENIDAIDANNAWVTTSTGPNTFIYKTSDGGNNWMQVYSQTGGFINGINMISASNGFAFGDPISNQWRILVTTNSGNNWLQHPLAPSATAGESGFVNSFQVMLPYIWFGNSMGLIYRTTNNGVNWTSHPTPGINTYIFAVHFNSLNIGMAAALSMVKSTDAGSVYSFLPAPGLGNINGIEGTGNNFWIIRGNNIYRSTNNGDSWNLEYDAGITQLHIDFPNNINGCLLGWSVGYAGSIHKMTGNPVGIVKTNNGIPENYSLNQNYPNPFNPSTNINFAIPEAGFIELKVFDVYGREVAVLVNSHLNEGSYNVSFDAGNLASGAYFYSLISGNFSQTNKMILIK